MIGDLHGRHEIAEAALNFDGRVVFIGDYMDSFDRTNTEQLRVLEFMLRHSRPSNDEFIALMGNHEMSYLYPAMRASGHTAAKQAMLMPYLNDMKRWLRSYYWLDVNVLVSHAGVSNKLLTTLNQTLNEYLDKGDYDQIGRIRSGYGSAGGLYWCDYYGEMEPIPGLIQVVGHTERVNKDDDEGIRYIDTNNGKVYNIDCLSRSLVGLVYDHETREFSPHWIFD